MAGGIQAAVIFSSVNKHPVMIYFFGGFCLVSLMPPIYKILLFFSPLLLSTAVCMVALMFLGPSTSQYTTSFNGTTALSNNSSTNNIDGDQQQSVATQEDDSLASLVNQFRTFMEPRVNTDQPRHQAPLINMAAAAGSSDVGNYTAVDDQYKTKDSTRKYTGRGPVDLKGEYINSGSSTQIESDQGPCDDTRPDRAALEADHLQAARPAECDDGQLSSEPDPDLAMEESARSAPALHAMENKAGDRAGLHSLHAQYQ